jgi:hypothetical protein
LPNVLAIRIHGAFSPAYEIPISLWSKIPQPRILDCTSNAACGALWT